MEALNKSIKATGDSPCLLRRPLPRALFLSFGAIMKILIFILVVITYIAYSALLQSNRFLDNHRPAFESMEVKSIGKYYQPFRVDYLEGWSTNLSKLVRVPVLTEKAEATAIGEHVSIVVGAGLFGKDWVAPKDKYEEEKT